MSMSDYDCKLVAEKLRYDKLIRKLRKRLRQIEHLELLERQLNDEEAVKVRFWFVFVYVVSPFVLCVYVH